jgi:hypothetical protein
VIGCGSFTFTSLEPRPVLVRGFFLGAARGRSAPPRQCLYHYVTPFFILRECSDEGAMADGLLPLDSR